MQEENGESLLPSLTTYIQNIRLSYVIVNVGRNKHYNLVGNVGREQSHCDLFIFVGILCRYHRKNSGRCEMQKV